MRRVKLLVPAIALVAVFALASIANSAVVIKGVSSGGNHWKPKTTSINNGTKVTWKAVSGSHTVTSYKGNWNKNVTLSQGQSTSFTFNNTGTYKFRCKFHSTLNNGVCSGMCGKVVVG